MSSDIQLTLDQQNAVHEFAMFMASPDTEFVISGPAGVGKTTLLRYLTRADEVKKVGQLLDKQLLKDWAFTATTNKAAEVLGQALGDTAQTIHSFLGLRVFNDFESGKTKISRGRNSEVKEDMVIVIDECSMVDRQLKKFIGECTMNCKIVYVGDHCQMAPVMEDISPVFENNQPVILREIVRSQHTPAITALCNQLRDTVETGIFKPIQGVPGVIDFLDPQDAEREIYDHFVVDHADARILSYTNKTAIGMNTWVRNARGLPETFEVDETVVSNNTCHFHNKDGMTRVEQELKILKIFAPSDHVEQVNRVMYTIPCYRVLTNAGELQICLDNTKLQGLLKETSRNQDWQKHYALKENFADLRPRDACTVYKAQGSTYKTSFVHLSDIGTCTNASQVARMLYVACSRATDRICFIGRLPPRFSGELM